MKTLLLDLVPLYKIPVRGPKLNGIAAVCSSVLNKSGFSRTLRIGYNLKEMYLILTVVF